MSDAVRNVSSIRGPLKTRKYSIIIPAAGMGNRVASYGSRSLYTLDGKTTLIQRQIKLIKEVYPINEIIVVAGFEADKVMANIPSDIIKVENEHYEKTQVVRSIGMGLRVCTTDRVVVIYGDLVFNKNALMFPANRDSLIVGDNSTMKDGEVGYTSHRTNVEYIFYDLPNKWAQIAYYTGKELELLKRIAWRRENSHIFGFEAINEIIRRGGSFIAVKPPGIKITDVDAIKDLKRAKEMLI